MAELAASYGIDVSHYQGSIDWAKVRAAGKSFAVIKATEGTTWVDPKFLMNRTQARQAGLAVGCYHYFRPGLDPKRQAQHFYAVAGNLQAGDLIPWLDVEDEHSSINGPTVPYTTIVGQLVDCVDEVSKLFGCWPGIYTGQWFWNRLAVGTLFQTIPLWVAYWFKDQRPGGIVPLPNGWVSYAIHQYTSKGEVDGITGAVDLDWSPDLAQIKWKGGGVDQLQAALAALDEARAKLDQVRALLGG